LAVLASCAILVVAWGITALPRLAADQSGVITFFLGALFASILMFRKKPETAGVKASGGFLAVLSGLGAVFVIAGIVIPVHQLEWLGVLTVLYAALAWVLPRRHGRDLLLALGLLYWIHPLPSQVFGPVQLWMQDVSVTWSEAVLQAFNVRVWGDGLVLRTAGRVFGVPEACSGMKTAITVLLCGVGVGLIMRFRWTLMAILLGLGFVQVLLLNVARITGIVWLGRDQAAGWDDKVLHDTMGIFMLMAVGLIHLDAVLIRDWCRRAERTEQLTEVNDLVGEAEDKLRRWPVFWRLCFRWWKVALVAFLVAGIVAVFARRLRPAHRAEMIRGVAQGLMPKDLPNAERAIEAALTLKPGDDALLYLKAMILVSRGRQEAGLAILRRKPEATRTLEERVLEARALLELRRTSEVASVVAAFPASALELPGVAMVLAEFNAALDRAGAVASHVVRAARGLGTQERIRRLYPYMASRDLWDSIRQTDADLPYANPLEGVIAVEARLRANAIAEAANVLRRALKDHEQDPVFLNSVIRVARELPQSEWVSLFERNFKANLRVLKPTDLTLAMDGAFAVGRPDLGWIAYRRLEAVAPDDPMLMIAPAEYGRRWFTFAHAAVGIPASRPADTVDMKPFYQVARGLSPWKELWDRIPLADELGGIATREGFQRRLLMGLAALEKVEAKGGLDFRLQLLYGQVLGELGRWDEAHAKLREFEQGSPRRRRDFLLAHGALYKAEGNWPLCFETLAEFARAESHPPLTVWLDLANAAMSLDLGPYAAGVLEEARRDYPESEEWSLAMGGLWSFFGFYEEALFIFNSMKAPPNPALKVRLMMETGRVVEGQKLAIVENLMEVKAPKRQAELLPPAEWALEWRGGTLSADDYARESAALKDRESPFLKELNALKRAWYRSRGAREDSRPSEWEKAGRDHREKALALNDLTVLLLRQGRTNEAVVTSAAALDHMPAWGLMWRIHLLLKQDPAMADKAVETCPWDGELWLARLVLRTRKGEARDWAVREIERVVADRRYSPGILVRAGDFCLRKDMLPAATIAAKAAIRDGQGLLPAYILGIACGVKGKDFGWAATCARHGAEQALEPWSFYKIIIGLKGRSGPQDPDVVRALEGLASRYPKERVWAERLGEMYFQKGQTDRALGVLEDAIAREEGKKQAAARTYAMAAEAARREGNLAKAVKILQFGRVVYPEDVNLLNNLIYTLAQDPMLARDAIPLLPEFLKRVKEDFAMYDTVALVYLRAGELKQAEQYMNKALSLVKRSDYAWLEVYLNAAEAQIRLGNFKEARRSLDLIMKSPERTPQVESRARELLNELAGAERDQHGWF
jgi:exosortase/archaeosortase family protein